jgi:Zn-dependent protease
MGRRLRLGTWYGVDVAIDWSWIVTFVLAAWTFVSIAAVALPEAGSGLLAFVTALSTAALFASIGLHELVHAWIARACGVPVRRVTMFLFGGITDVEREPASPRSETVAALGAPATSAAIGAFALLAATAVHAAPAFTITSALLAWVGVVNIAIAAINLVPAYPLDGGRLARALLWRLFGDVDRATRWAAWGGQVFGWSALVVGVGIAFTAPGPGLPLGLWLAFIGWFLASAAAQAHEAVALQGALAGMSVATILRRAADGIPGDVTVATGVRGWLGGADGRALPVVEGDRFLGVVSMRDARALPVEQWRGTAIAELARREQGTVAPWEDVTSALRTMVALDLDRLPVVAGDRLVGAVHREDAAAWLSAHADGAGSLARTGA